MSDAQPWLGRVHLARPEIETEAQYTALAAVFCETREDFDTLLSKALAGQGASLLWSEDVRPAGPWIARSPAEQTAAALARSVHPGHAVELGALTAAAKDTKSAGNDSYLIIEEIEGVEPLDAQMGVWPRKTVPDALYEPLFGQPEPTEGEIALYGSADAVPQMNTFAILDAAKLPYLLTGMLEDSGLRHKSLFQGAAQEELKEHAPYLVELAEDNSFTRALFTADAANALWDKDLGIYIRSRTGFDDIRKHFRKFTRVKDEEGQWSYLRYWEPTTLRALPEFFEKVNKELLFEAGYSFVWVDSGTNTCGVIHCER